MDGWLSRRRSGSLSAVVDVKFWSTALGWRCRLRGNIKCVAYFKFSDLYSPKNGKSCSSVSFGSQNRRAFEQFIHLQHLNGDERGKV
jgi:hypothetical protein